MEQTTQSGTKKNTGMAVIAYLIFFIPLLTDAKNDPFVKFHVKQGLVLFLGYVIEMVLVRFPVIGWFAPLLGLGLFVLLIIGIVNAVNGEEKPLPLIGELAKNFKF